MYSLQPNEHTSNHVNKGKTILLSLVGAQENHGFINDTAGQPFADIFWKFYDGGSSNTRPFGDAVLDDFDLDIERDRPIGYAVWLIDFYFQITK
jgi:chitinase